MGRAVGIDLGTTYSAVSVIGANGAPEIIPNREGERITPSVVLFQDDSVAVGSMAKQAASDAPDDVVQFVKRKMGDRSWAFVTSTGDEYDAEWISAVILRRLKEDAELALGEDVTDAVITVPAYFDDSRRRATIDAGKIAGINVLGVINEPTAAAVAYGLESGIQGNVLVYDLGGGTFDVTLMRILETDFEVLASRGDRNLGGFNWDNELITYIASQVMAKTGCDLLDDNVTLAEVREKAELAKRTLTTMPEARVVVRVERKPVTVRITRAVFEDLTRGLLSRTATNVELAIEDAGLEPSDIDFLLLVGGSTRMPMVREMLIAATGCQPSAGVNPDEAVAMGAAVQAMLLIEAQAGPDVEEAGPPLLGGSVQIHDVTSFGLGIVTLRQSDQHEVNHILVRQNSPVPGAGEQTFFTAADDQRDVLVRITEGDDTDLDFVNIVGEASMALPPRAGRTALKVRISFSRDAVIYAEVFDDATGAKIGDLQIDRESNLTARQIDQAATSLQNWNVS